MPAKEDGFQIALPAHTRVTVMIQRFVLYELERTVRAVVREDNVQSLVGFIAEQTVPLDNRRAILEAAVQHDLFQYIVVVISSG